MKVQRKIGAMALLAGLGCALATNAAFAQGEDAVDRAVAKARSAAESRDWGGAALSYEEARNLLPGASSELSLELGTVYGHLGRYGDATLHLNEVLSQNATKDVLEAARTNLGVVRRQMESEAEEHGLRLSRSLGALDVVVSVIAAPASATLAIGAGLLAGLAWLAGHFLTDVASRWRRVLIRSALLLASIWFVIGVAHGLARSYEGEGRAIVVASPGAFHEGPGTHRPRLFGVASGSQIVILEKGSAWLRVRLVGGPEGWIAREQVRESSD